LNYRSISKVQKSTKNIGIKHHDHEAS
jgi:hypothetical protein